MKYYCIQHQVCLSLLVRHSSKLVVKDKPLILLDIDGVINMHALSKEEQTAMWSDSERKPNVNGYNIDYSPSMVKLISSWNLKADVQWLTTWDDKANKYLAPALGLPEFPVAREAKEELSKDKAFFKHAEKDPERTIIWIDDELLSWKDESNREIDRPGVNGCKDEEEEEQRQTSIKVFRRPNTLYLSPKCGLTPAHCDLVQKVLDDPSFVKDKVVDELEPGDRGGCVVC